MKTTSSDHAIPQKHQEATPARTTTITTTSEADTTTTPTADSIAPKKVSQPERGTISRHKSVATFASARTASFQKRAEYESSCNVFFPWSKKYRVWWGFTVFCAFFTTFFETYEIAFAKAGLSPYNDASSIIEYTLTSIFVVDIVVNFNLAFINERDEIVFRGRRIAEGEIVYERRLIAKIYLRFMFWIDLIGVLPFYAFALACAGELGKNSTLAQYLALFRLLKLVRLRRVNQLLKILQQSSKISLMWLTLIRNFSVALVWAHLAACIMYFIARQYSFDEDETWIGGSIADLSGSERYLTTLYWSVVTFTTVGYGDFSPVNSAEQIWGMIYMLLNIILHSWIIGSITLLVVKNDEKTGLYRETLRTLDQYSTANSFDRRFHKKLKMQLKLDFESREIADEQVLKHFPASVRRKVLRRLYLPSLVRTSLMEGIRQQFVDAFLTTCNVEIFSPGEDILQRGSISSDLYLLVEGDVEAVPIDTSTVDNNEDSNGGYESIPDSDIQAHGAGIRRHVGAGDFINEIGFFTESPQIDTVRTITVCKTLTMPQSSYKIIAQNHPGSAGKILQNLLAKVEEMSEDVDLPKNLSVLRAGSVFDPQAVSHSDEVQQAATSVQNQAALTSVQELVKMHINKQKDDHTTRFLFAASRDDAATIALMCDQGFDPDSSDYDCRTALMVAAMKGNKETVSKLLEYHANPNLVDVHGSSALYEAARTGHESVMEELLKHGAELGMDESLAASTLCQAVFDGDTLLLRRLLRARIQANASDYDKRAAVHIAAAEGNIAALKVLVEFDADLTVRDRWNNTVNDEAERAKAGQLVEYLKTL